MLAFYTFCFIIQIIMRTYVDCAVFVSSVLGEIIVAVSKANGIVYNCILFSTINDLGVWAVPEDLNSNHLVLNLYVNHNANHQMAQPSS